MERQPEVSGMRHGIATVCDFRFGPIVLGVAEFTTAGDGTYALPLAPGSYQVRLRDSNTLPSMAAAPFTVREGWSLLNLQLDSGIR